MAKIRYTKDQVKELKRNKYVKDCTEKYLTFTDAFKIKVLQAVHKGIYHRQVFFDVGFPAYVGNSELVPRIVGNWKHKEKQNGIASLVGNRKGRKKKELIDISTMTKDEYIEYLEAKLYME